jgi:hypothetical protein
MNTLISPLICNSEKKFKTIDDIESYQLVLQAIRQDEMRRFTRVLHRMRSIDAEVEVNLITSHVISRLTVA